MFFESRDDIFLPQTILLECSLQPAWDGKGCSGPLWPSVNQVLGLDPGGQTVPEMEKGLLPDFTQRKSTACLLASFLQVNPHLFGFSVVLDSLCRSHGYIHGRAPQSCFPFFPQPQRLQDPFSSLPYSPQNFLPPPAFRISYMCAHS